MSIFAHIESGFALDVWPNATQDDYEARFKAMPDFGTWQIVEVPADTKHGAKVNGDGTYTNPASVVIPKTPRILSKTGFQDYAVSQLGGGVTGMGRFTDIMDATESSLSSTVRFAFARYQAADTFEKDKTAILTQIMAADSTVGHLTSAERTAILDNWPT